MERQEIKRQNFNSDLVSYFSSLRQDKQLHNVTLYLSAEHIYPAHRILLAFSSTYFLTLFSSVPTTSHNIVTLPQDLTHTEVTSLLDYIYLGRVSLPKTDVNTFLELAARFQLRGLSQDGIVTQPDRKESNIIKVSCPDNVDLIKDITDHDSSGNYIGNKREYVVGRTKFRRSTKAQSVRLLTSRAHSGQTSSRRLLSTPRALPVPKQRALIQPRLSILTPTPVPTEILVVGEVTSQ